MSLCSRIDVTSVKLLGHFILAGVGSYLQIYDRESRSFLQRLQALKGQRIYGIISNLNQDQILIFGGKQFTVVSINKLEAEIALHLELEPIHCDDWLQHGVWTSNNQVALLTSHNVVQHWDVSIQKLTATNQSKNNSVLYSGTLINIEDDVLVLAGTVFSEVLISLSWNDELLHTLKGHKGVIFSVACNLETQIIASTSDDRSVCIWKPKNKVLHAPNTKLYWRQVEIACAHRVFGHLARVMRCCIINDKIISAGEDSNIIYWNTEGELVKKIPAHENGSIWTLDVDQRSVVTGGSDCGIFIHPVQDYKPTVNTLDVTNKAPKKIMFTARRNLVLLTEDSVVNYYDVELNMNVKSMKLEHESTYILMSISECKQIIATVDMCGNLDVFTEICKGEPNIVNILNTKLSTGKVLSMHWAGNRHIIFCNDKGQITVLAANANKCEEYTEFILPPCKERWLTSVAIDNTNKTFVLGDRCGNIHIYKVGNKNPIKTFPKVHGRYGPTTINMNKNDIITTGRDGSIKLFHLSNDTKYMNSREVNFDWVEKFLDRDRNIICGFQERVFIVHDLKCNMQLISVPCGGGHRSWDAVRYIEKNKDKYEAFIKFVYVKNFSVHEVVFELSKCVSVNVVKGIQAKEINCMNVYKTGKDPNIRIYFSGGEDTTVRVTTNKVNNDQDFTDEILYKHLSNVRTLKTLKINDNKLLVVTGGGRAQICIKIIHITKVNDEVKVNIEAAVDYMIKGTDKQRKGNQNWRNCSVDFDPETRIMDLDIKHRKDNVFHIYAGCSDAILRIFEYIHENEENSFKLIYHSGHHNNCILKTHLAEYKDINILITTTTRGLVTLWDITNVSTEDLKPFYEKKSNKCGVNSIATKTTKDNDLLIVTGGDDNAINIITINILNKTDVKLTGHFSVENWHHCQITGLGITKDDFIVSTSIDQRVTLSQWHKDENGLTSKFVSQSYSDVADVQGLDIVDDDSDTVTVCVFGKGMELIQMKKPKLI